jgi:hypothetical protein
LEQLIGSGITLAVSLQFRSPILGIRTGAGAMLGTAVPKAAIDKDGDAVPREGDVDTDISLTSDNGGVVAKAEASSVQGRAQRHLRLGIATAIRPHDVAYCGIGGRRVVDAQTSPE